MITPCKYKNFLFYVSVYFLFCSSSLFAEVISGRFASSPVALGRTYYYDIDISGRLLKVDYLHNRATCLAHLPIQSQGLMGFETSYYLACDKDFFALLKKSKDQFFLYSKRKDILTRIPIPEYPGITEVFPINENVIYINYDEFRVGPQKHISYNPSTGTVNFRGDGYFPFELPDDINSIFINNGEEVLATPQQGEGFYRIKIQDGSILESLKFRDFLQITEPTSSVSIVAATGCYAVIQANYSNSDKLQYYLFDFLKRQVLAQSAQLPFWPCEKRLEIDVAKPCRIACIQCDIVDFKTKYTGHVQYLKVWDTALVPSEDMDFNPEKEIPLIDDNGKLIVTKTHRYDYFSLIELINKAQISLAMGCYHDETLIEEAMGKFKRQAQAERSNPETSSMFQKLEIEE